MIASVLFCFEGCLRTMNKEVMLTIRQVMSMSARETVSVFLKQATNPSANAAVARAMISNSPIDFTLVSFFI